jgi:topoisomerase IA-like protein
VVRLSNTFDLSSLIGGNRGGLFGGIAKAAGGAMSKVAEGQVRKDLTTSLEKLRSLVEKEVKAKPAAKAAVKRPAAKKPAAKKPAAKKSPARR